jgi:hypothetical protein
MQGAGIRTVKLSILKMEIVVVIEISNSDVYGRYKSLGHNIDSYHFSKFHTLANTEDLN